MQYETGNLPLFENYMLKCMGDKMNVMPDHMIHLNGD